VGVGLLMVISQELFASYSSRWYHHLHRPAA